MDVIFWTWFILLHCISMILLWWWDQEKSEKYSLKAKYIKLISEWESVTAELERQKKREESKKDPFEDWEEFLLTDLSGQSPESFMDILKRDNRSRIDEFPVTMRINFDGYIKVGKKLSDGLYYYELVNLYFEGTSECCFRALEEYLSGCWKYLEQAAPCFYSGVVRLYRKKS